MIEKALQHALSRTILRVGIAMSIVGLSASCTVTSSTKADQASETSSPSTPGVTLASQDSKLVFAHYFPPYPISIDNLPAESDFYAAEYLNPNGADSAFGGRLRDRPVPRPPRPTEDWRLLDLREEVRQAAAAGIDGFTVDILTKRDSIEWIGPVASLLLQAAEEENPSFKIMLMPDMDGAIGQSSPGELAAEMAMLAQSPASYRLADGRLVISPYRAENRPAAWWSEFMDAMRQQHGIDVALVPVFQDTKAYTPGFAAISFGVSIWGGRNPAFNPVAGFPIDEVRRFHADGKLWMQPVSAQDYRPIHQIFDEAENTTNLRNTWQIAIDSASEWVQIATWNDYAEHTAVAPSTKHGENFLDISSYYISQFKDGAPPAIQKDRVFLTHRTQVVGAPTAMPQQKLATLRPGSSPVRNTVEALTFLAAPAEVEVNVGSSRTTCAAPAGVSTCLAPLPLGPSTATVSTQISRDGKSVTRLVSPFPVVSRPFVEDLQYTASSSER